MTTSAASRRTARRWGWFVVVAVALVALVRAGTDDGPALTTEQRVRDIAATIRCPTCLSQSAADSDAASARAIRLEIARRLDQGQSADEIRAGVADGYGDDVLLTPSGGGFEGLVWVLPVAALVLALAGLWAAFARWRASPSTTVSDEDRELVERARRGR